MRYSLAHRKETFDKIVESASKLFNERGYNGVGIDSIMRAVGLTPGGFYNHFKSKDALFATALEESKERFKQILTAGVEEAPNDVWMDVVLRRYLSREHRDDISSGCPLPPLAADVSRDKNNAREIFEAYFKSLVEIIEEHTDARNNEDRLDLALGTISLAVGGILLARSVKSKRLSDRILLATRRVALAQKELKK